MDSSIFLKTKKDLLNKFFSHTFLSFIISSRLPTYLSSLSLSLVEIPFSFVSKNCLDLLHRRRRSNNIAHRLCSMSGTTFRRTSFAVSKPTATNQVREKERFELSTLNDKFADYVEKVRYLEAQNKKIQLESNHLLEKQNENCSKIKSLFDSEITQLKALVENLFQNKNTAFSNSQDTQVHKFILILSLSIFAFL